MYEDIDKISIDLPEPYNEYDAAETKDLDEKDKFNVEEPFDTKLVDIQVMQTTMDTLIKRLRHNEIDLMPDFQRNANLWSKETKGRLIESLLLRFPLPAFYFDATNDENWLVVDGLQRLITIQQFVINDELKLKGLEFLHNGCNNKTYENLSRSMQRRILEASVTLYLIKPGTPELVKYSIFHRINTGGLRLNAQEIRHALNQAINNGQASTFLSTIVETDIFKKVVGVSEKRMLDKELVLRYLAFKLINYKEYKPPMVNFLNSAMASVGRLNIFGSLLFKLEFEKSLNVAFNLFGDDAFRKSLAFPESTKVLNRALFEVCTVLFSQLTNAEIDTLNENKNAFVEAFKNILRDDDFNSCISYSTTSTSNVNKRFEEISSILNKYKSRC